MAVVITVVVVVVVVMMMMMMMMILLCETLAMANSTNVSVQPPHASQRHWPPQRR